jgi:DNA-binding MarR family transcriptional regulator
MSRWSDPRDDDDRSPELDQFDWYDRDRSDDSHDLDPRAIDRVPEFDGESRDPFARQLDLPNDDVRERVLDRQHDIDLRGSETRLMANIGAFRVLQLDDYRDCERSQDGPAPGDIQRLKRAGFIEERAHVFDGERVKIATLTREGRNFLERHRHRDRDQGQRYYDGISKPRELAHDAQIYRAYRHTVDRLERDLDARVQRVMLDNELKREYQQFLQERNRGDALSDGRPKRTEEEICDWAQEHNLPVIDGSVQFPDVRIEYELPNHERHIEDVEVLTEDYRGVQMAAKSQSGFTCYRSSTGRVSGASGKRGGGRPFDPRAAKDFL